MKFSVIVPVYNVERYLGRCLDSILSQTYQDFEVIVVNDGSPDNSQAIIDDYAARYPNKIKALVKENGGLSDARNFGIERASGDYLLFVDSDDFIAEDALLKLAERAERDQYDLIAFNAVFETEDGALLERYDRPESEDKNGREAIIALVDYKKCFEPAWGFAYRRAYWSENGFEFMKGIYHEDFALIPLVVLKAEKVAFLDLDLYHYISTDNSITRTYDPERASRLAGDLLKGYDFLSEECRRYGASDKYAEKMYMAYASNALIARLDSLQGQGKKLFRAELRKRRISNHIISDTPKRKLRKLFIRLKNGI